MTMTISPANQPFVAPVFEDVMIDIETMSLHPHKALILSIGMLEFDPKTIGMVIGSRSLFVLDLASQLMQRRLVDPSTQKFWAEQPSEASHHWRAAEDYTDTVTAMQGVRSFCMGKKRVWANGTQFDLSNLIDLAADNGVHDLWHYRAPRDMRTFVEETNATRLVPIGDALDIKGVAHEPLYDCEIQAWKVWAHWRDT